MHDSYFTSFVCIYCTVICLYVCITPFENRFFSLLLILFEVMIWISINFGHRPILKQKIHMQKKIKNNNNNNSTYSRTIKWQYICFHQQEYYSEMNERVAYAVSNCSSNTNASNPSLKCFRYCDYTLFSGSSFLFSASSTFIFFIA